MMEELLLSNRTRHLIIKANLTNVRSVLSGDQEIFTQAIKNLIFYTTLSGDGGSIEIAASVDEDGWITISTTGSAYSGAIAPKQTLLDEGHYFLKELSTGLKPDANVSLFMGLYLAKIIIESLGGTLSVSTQENPGFVIRLPESL
jgi:signal transduction histidine kinase